MEEVIAETSAMPIRERVIHGKPEPGKILPLLSVKFLSP